MSENGDPRNNQTIRGCVQLPSRRDRQAEFNAIMYIPKVSINNTTTRRKQPEGNSERWPRYTRHQTLAGALGAYGTAAVRRGRNTYLGYYDLFDLNRATLDRVARTAPNDRCPTTAGRRHWCRTQPKLKNAAPRTAWRFDKKTGWCYRLVNELVAPTAINAKVDGPIGTLPILTHKRRVRDGAH